MAFLGNASGSSTSTGSFARVLAADTLHVDGLITQGGVGSGTQNIFIGGDAGGAPNNTGTTRSVIIGAAAASKLTTGDHVVAIGYQAGGAYDTATGDHNGFVAVGSGAGSKVVTNASRYVLIGNGAGGQAIGPSNSVLIGYNAGALAYSGSNNVLIGYQAGFTMGTSAGETPNNNIAIGLSAMEDAGDATYNVAVGDEALKNIIGFNNTAIGKSALNGHINGDGNVAIGAEAMMDAGEDGGVIDNQVAIGSGALKNIDTFGTLYANIAIGQNTAQNVVTSSFNTIMGYRALYSATGVGSANLVIGNSAAYASTGSTFHANVILGDYAGYQTKGKENVLIGEYAGHDLESGQQNVVIGANAARFSNKFQSNTNSVLVGHRTDASADGNSNENVFGYNTTGLGSNTVTLGNASITDVYMASDSGATIHAAGISGSGGNLALIGDISGSATSTGSFGVLQLNKFNAGIGSDTNVNFGEGAGATGASATNNLAIGYNAGNFSNAGSSLNIAIGWDAQGHWTDADGDRNIAIGYQAMYDHNGGDDNIAIGYQAMKNGEGSGMDNIAIGTDAMQAIGAGASRNIGLGDRAQHYLVTGTDNVSVGKDSLFTNVDGDYNVAFGTEALYGINAESADKNVAVGYRAGIFIANGSTQFTDGDSNVFIGSETKPAADDESNQIIIGANAIGKGSNTALIGDDNITDIYMSEDLGAMVHVGNISGSATSTGSFGRVNVNGSGTRMAFNTGTTDGTIDFLAIDDGGTVSKIQLFSDDAGGSTGINMMTDSNFAVSKLNNTTLFKITENSGHVEFPAANQKISGSAASSASFGQLTLKHGTIDAQYGSQVWPGAPTGGGAGNGGFNVKTMAFGSIYIGHDVGLLDDGNNQNVGIGVDVLGANTGGNQLVAIGKDAMRLATGMSSDIAIGIDAMEEAHDTLYTIAIGALAAQHLGKGSSNSDYNIAIGFQALKNNANGNANVAIGRDAMEGVLSGSQNIAIGQYSMGHTAGNQSTETNFRYNVAVGTSTMTVLKQGSINVAIGNSAMQDAGGSGTDIDETVAVGGNALEDLQTGDGNTAVGFKSMWNMATGSYNVAIGNQAMGGSNNANFGDGADGDTTVSNDQNVAIGYFALQNCENGNGNTALGARSMMSAGSTGAMISGNIALGSGALQRIERGAGRAGTGLSGQGGNGNFAALGAGEFAKSGSGNILMGYRAGYSNNDQYNVGGHNIFMGYTAGFATSASINNIALGFEAGYNLNSDDNVLLGYRAGKALAGSQGTGVTDGTRNVIIGRGAGSALTSGSYNVVVGADSYFFGKGATNQTLLGKGITGQADNSVVLGNTDVTKVYMAQDGAAEIFANGTINTSDRRLKENIDDSDLGLEFINKVRPVRYTYINDKQKDGKTKYGIIAQEVQEVLKEINNEDFAGIKDGNPDKLGADYVQFIAPLIKSVQELTEMVKAQQKEIEELKK